MIIDIYLLRLRYEILNIPLAQLAEEIEVPLPVLENEARANEWTQWWPDLPSEKSPSNLDLSPEVSYDPITYTEPDSTTEPPPPACSTNPIMDDDGEIIEFDDISPLEEGANSYLTEKRLRLEVYTLAKDIHLTHKYATFESALIDRAKEFVDKANNTQEVLNLVKSLKDLPGKATSTKMQISSEDGIPSVIIRDLSGRG